MPDAETLLDGDRVQRFFNDYSAVVEGSDGRPMRLIDSQVPLRVSGSEDDRELVDLDLVPQGSGFAPENGLVDLQLPTEVSNGIELGPVRIVPDGRAGVDRVDADTLAYPNVGTDTDLAVNATTTGFEVFYQLRSPDAPEVQRLRVELPSGSSLRTAEGGGAEVVRDERVMLEISPHVAVDAQGRSVPTSYEIDGGGLAIRTPRTGLALLVGARPARDKPRSRSEPPTSPKAPSTYRSERPMRSAPAPTSPADSTSPR